MSYLRGSFSPKSYFPQVWFAEADDSHLLPEEQSGGMLATMAEKESRKIAEIRRQVAEQQAYERKLAAERKAKIEDDRQAELDRIEQERQRVAAIEAYRLPDAIVSPVISDISQNTVEIEPELLRKLDLIAKSAKDSVNVSIIDEGNIAPDYSDDIALIMILLEAA